MTFYHHIEEMHAVPYRFHKEFSGNYIDWDGKESIKTYGLFVRDLDKGVLTHVNPMGELLWENGLYQGYRPKEDTGLRVISAKAMFSFVSEFINAGKAKGLLYIIEGESKDA
jgi:aminoglycoside 3-N-acetyltransferase